MMDLFELRHLYVTIKSTEELDFKAIELVKTVFGRHTLLSVLQYNDDHMIKILDLVGQEQQKIVDAAGSASDV